MNTYLLLSLFFGLSFFSFGVKLYRNPGGADVILAYRTSASLRNEDTWYEANHYAGRCLMMIGALLLLVLIFLEYYLNNINALFYFLGGGILISIALVYLFTELHLKHVFFRDGKRRPRF